MLIDETEGYLETVRKFAEETNQLKGLQERLDYLGNYGCNSGRQTRCRLYKDFAPMSFYFVMEVKKEDDPDNRSRNYGWSKDDPDSEYRRWFNGGLIYFDAGDTGVSGPQYSVRIDSSKSGWSVHT